MKIPIRTTPYSNGALSYETPTEALKVALMFEDAEPDDGRGDTYVISKSGYRDWRVIAVSPDGNRLWAM